MTGWYGTRQSIYV